MAWLLLIIAGLLESAWAIGLKYTEGFTRPVPSVLTILGIVASMYLLAVAANKLPIGTAYAVWVGIGAAGAVVLGIVLLGESANPLRLFFLGLLLVSIMGLKYATPPEKIKPRVPVDTAHESTRDDESHRDDPSHRDEEVLDHPENCD